MKKLVVVCMVLFIMAVPGCRQNLTLDKVEELSQKGEALTWADFEDYPSVATGSGLYILVYDIDSEYSLWIGGAAPGEEPMYIHLVRNSGGDHEEYIDIRTEDVSAFVG